MLYSFPPGNDVAAFHTHECFFMPGFIDSKQAERVQLTGFRFSVLLYSRGWHPTSGTIAVEG